MPPKMSCFSSLVEPIYRTRYNVSAVWVSISGSGNILCTPERPDVLRGTPSFLPCGLRGSFLGGKATGAELTTAVHA